MKKNTTKILMAALALFMAIGIATGTTFAWFALNNTVTATGMQVEAKSNSTFLLIGEEACADAAAIQAQDGDDKITENLNVTALDAAVYPAKPKAAAEIGGGKLFETGTPVTDKDSAATEANWYTANSTDPAQSTTNVTNQTSLTAGNFSNYVIKRTVKLTVAVGSNNANNLEVTGEILARGLTKPTAGDKYAAGKTYYSYAAGVYTIVDTDGFEAGVTDTSSYYSKTTAGTEPDTIDITAVKVLVATDDGGFAILSCANNGTPVDIKGSNTALTDSTVLVVDLYIYYDGSATIVTSNDKADLGAASIALAFDVDVAP